MATAVLLGAVLMLIGEWIYSVLTRDKAEDLTEEEQA